MLAAPELSREFLVALYNVLRRQLGRGFMLVPCQPAPCTITCVTQRHEPNELDLPIGDFTDRIIHPTATVMAAGLSERCPAGPIVFHEFEPKDLTDTVAVCEDRRMGIAVRVVRAFHPGSLDGVYPEGWYTRYEVAWSKP